MIEITNVKSKKVRLQENSVIDIRLMNYCSSLKINDVNVEELSSQKNMKEDIMRRVT